MESLERSETVRRATIAALLALAVVLAGCSTGQGPATEATPDDPAASPDGTGTATPTMTPTPTSTPTASPTPTLDEASLGERHDRNLRQAGSFTVVYVVSMAGDGGTIENARRVAADFDGGRGYSVTNLTTYDPDGSPNVTITAETYVEGTSEYERTKLGEVGDPLVSEDTLPAPDGINETNVMAGNGTVAMRGGDVDYWVSGHDWRWDGVTTLDGGVAHRYRLASSEFGEVLLDEVLYGNDSLVTGVEATDSRLVVKDGVVRRLELDLQWTGDDGDTTTMTVEMRVTDVGTTSVEPPGWVDS